MRRETDAFIDSIAVNAIIAVMATITIRKLPEDAKRRLRMRAAANGRSMEEEAREMIVRGAASLESNKPSNSDRGSWVDKLIAEMRAIGDAELVLPDRQPMEEPIEFSGPDFRS